jgi:glycosyltransferase involved in cell wall biosynthesis
VSPHDWLNARGLTVIVASSRRPTLARTLASIEPQLTPGDELIVDVNTDSPWGHNARNRCIPKARPGNGLCFMDDDDAYLPGALALMRAAYRAEPLLLHVFRMNYHGQLLWRTKALVDGNVSTQMFVTPQPANEARWTDRYQGDYDYITAMAEHHDIRWHEEPIAIYGPS